MSKLVPKWFEKIGFTTECYELYRNNQDGKTTSQLEREILKFKNSKKTKNKITLLFSINILNEGVHIDDVDGLIFLRKTVSPIIMFQQLGRALKSGNKSPLIFDFVNNISGFNFDDRLKLGSKISIKKIFNKEYMINSDIEVIDYVEQIELLLRRIEKLSAFTTWQAFIDGLVEYKNEHGHCNVPSNHHLYKKCLNIRKDYREGTLNENKFKDLDKLGFKWEISVYDNERWEFMFQKLIEFKSIFGHANVLRSYKDKQLATWVHTQRKFKDTMPNERKEKLLSIGFKFKIAEDENQKNWEEMFDKLLEFKREFKHVNVSSRYKDKKLANWVNSQRKAYKANKLDDYRYDKLVSVGFMFAK
ncbi:MAG: Helicase associated domain protein [Romboutsia sp.]|nr:Helicase associated domain protein [Romboutsia sp.]